MKVELMASYPVTCVPETHLAHGIRDLRPSSIRVADVVSGAVVMCGRDGEAQTVLATLEPRTQTASPVVDAA